jgi:hypothetical protein
VQVFLRLQDGISDFVSPFAWWQELSIEFELLPVGFFALEFNRNFGASLSHWKNGVFLFSFALLKSCRRFFIVGVDS